MSAITISELAKYILVSCAEKQITPMKLQKLAYYVKAWTLVAGYPQIMDAQFEKWEHGPVNKELYNEYKAYRNRVIKEKVDPPTLHPDDQQIIDFILENYSDYTAFDLSAITHNEAPWQETKVGQKILDHLIIRHYSQEPFAKNFDGFDPDNNPFYMLRDQTWHAFTMDMTHYDKELSTSMPSYTEYKALKQQAESDIILFKHDRKR